MQLGQLVEHLHSALDHVIQKSQLADEVGQLWITEWRFAKSRRATQSFNMTGTEYFEHSSGILSRLFLLQQNIS